MIDQLTESESERAQHANDARKTEGELEEDGELEDTDADDGQLHTTNTSNTNFCHYNEFQ